MRCLANWSLSPNFLISGTATKSAFWDGEHVCSISTLCHANLTASVDKYDLTTHGLILSHPSASEVPQQAFAHANVAHVLESIQHTALEKGAWVNVIGYVVSKKNVKGARAQIVKVDAVVLWEAKEINLQEYERGIEMRKVAERLFTTPSRMNAQLHPE